MTSTTKKQLKYKVELETLNADDKKFKADGDTVLDAINNLGLTWEDIKFKGNIKVSYGKKKTEKLFYLPQLRKVFASRVFRIMQSKYLEKLLK